MLVIVLNVATIIMLMVTCIYLVLGLKEMRKITKIRKEEK